MANGCRGPSRAIWSSDHDCSMPCPCSSPLTLVSAPAGYGKTVLLDAWAARAGRGLTVVHTALDEEASDPRLFWKVVLDAVRTAGVDVSGVRVGNATPGALDSLLRHVEAHHRPVVWVLDCDEFSMSAEVGHGLDHLIRQCSDVLTVVILTRTDPPLPLHSYRLTGAVTDLRAADLAFTTTETEELLRRQGLRLEPASVAELLARTGGWPAGLRFAGLSLVSQPDVDRAIHEFRGDVGNIVEYLMAEVLNKQTEETRQFLLRTCVADELVPGVVEALWGRPCDLRTLEVMARGSVFIDLAPGRHDRYRFAVLFREFLRGQLAFEAPELLPQLHRTAARWYAHEGNVFAAIRHASLASDWQLATELFVDRLAFARLLTGQRGGRLRQIFGDLPSSTAGANAALARAALAVSDLDLAQGELHLGSARQLMAQEPSLSAPTRALAVAVLDAVVASLGDDTDAALRAALVAEKSLRRAPTRDVAALEELSAVVSACKGRVLFERGDLAAGAVALSHGLTAADAADTEVVAAQLKGMSALVAAVTGRLDEATELALEVSPGVADSLDCLERPGMEAATLALAWARADESEPQLARDLLDQAEGQHTSYDSKVLGAVLSLLRARVLSSDGEVELALAEIQGALAPAGPGPFAAPVTGWLADSLMVSEASLRLALEGPDAAVPPDQPAARRVPAQHTPSRSVDVAPIVMPLTAKETEVLGYLADLLTTDEIAATMFVSINTVRSHVRSILRKLGASRRNEAVRRAWDLGLLQS